MGEEQWQATGTRRKEGEGRERGDREREETEGRGREGQPEGRERGMQCSTYNDSFLSSAINKTPF